nr:DUF4395 domain-containing protein [Mycetocola tolaasinivorans]
MSAAETPVRPGPPPGKVDPRAPRVGAAITSVLLVLGVFFAIIGTSTGGNLGGLSISARIADPGFLIQLLVAVLFAWSLIAPASQPLTVIFRRLVRPRLSAPTEWEDARPPRFAQGVGLTVVGIGLVLHLIGVPWALVIAGSAAFIAAFLNAAVGFCLGCEIYLLLVRAGLIGRGTRATA